MARTEIALSVRSATLTDDSSGSAIAQVVREVTTDATDPQLAQFVGRFDDGTAEHLFWQFRLPGNFRSLQDGGFPALRVQFYMDDDQVDDSKVVRWQTALLAVTPRGSGGSPAGDTDEMTSLDLTNDGGGWVTASVTLDHASPATDDRLYEVVLDLSGNMDGAAAGDYVVLGLRRDADDASDTASGDACVLAAALEYTV